MELSRDLGAMGATLSYFGGQSEGGIYLNMHNSLREGLKVAHSAHTLYTKSTKERELMFEFNGELFENEADFLEAAKEEYQTGDQQLVLDALEEFGFDLSDLGVA